jgi:hypothetical protein
MANCQWRFATNDNRKSRQVRQVIGGFRQRSECSRQVIGASRNQRDHQSVCFTRGPESLNGATDRRWWSIGAQIHRVRDTGEMGGDLSKPLLQRRRQLDNLEAGRLGGIGGEDVQAPGIADDGESISSR